MSYGKTSAAIVLEDIVKKVGGISLVGAIMDDFNKGLKFLETINDRTMYESFWNIWVKEVKRRVQSSSLGDKIKKTMLAVIVGISRNQYRHIMLKNNWTSKNIRKVFESANEKHDLEFYKKLMENKDG